jgi:Methyltransferase domain
MPDFDWDAINSQGIFSEKDYVSNKLPFWIPLMSPMRDRKLSVLEIGSMEGRSALFFMSYFPDATITCVDPLYGHRAENFEKNLSRFSSRVQRIRDFSLPALTALRNTRKWFDIIYIDGNHERETVMMDSVLCWGMLNVGGLVIWDDYGNYKTDKENWERPKTAIDGFLAAYEGEYEELVKSKQVIVRKTVETPRCVVRQTAMAAPQLEPAPSSDSSELGTPERSLRNAVRLLKGRPLRRAQAG